MNSFCKKGCAMKKIFMFLKLGVVFLAISAIYAKFSKAENLYDATSKLSMFNDGGSDGGDAGSNSPSDPY